jgi:hypothetical protein
MTLAQSEPKIVYKIALLPPSPPGEKATTRQDQAGQSSTGDGAWNRCNWSHCYGFSNKDFTGK